MILRSRTNNVLFWRHLIATTLILWILIFHFDVMFLTIRNLSLREFAYQTNLQLCMRACTDVSRKCLIYGTLLFLEITRKAYFQVYTKSFSILFLLPEKNIAATIEFVFIIKQIVMSLEILEGTSSFERNIYRSLSMLSVILVI